MTPYSPALLIRNLSSLVGKFARPAALVAVAFSVAVLLTACKSTPSSAESPGFAPAGSETAASPEVLILREGDAVRITFPGAPNLNTVQVIRRDGKIAPPLVGEVQAAGMTCPQLEKELLKLYGPQLQTKEVTVTVESSAFPIYVTGSVLRPGKILSGRPLTALEAIMEAGGFDYTRANLKEVKVIREENGKQSHYQLNFKGVLKGQQVESFKLKPSDMIFVPERFTWF